MAVAEGNKVKVHYTGTFEDGSVFDSSEGKDPIEFTVGEHKVVKGFENAVIGMEKDQEKEIKIQPEDAYGPRHEQLVKEVPKTMVPPGQEVKIGMVLGLQSQDGHKLMAKVLEITDDKLKLDLNHPLAGKVLNFKIKLIDC